MKKSEELKIIELENYIESNFEKIAYTININFEKLDATKKVSKIDTIETTQDNIKMPQNNFSDVFYKKIADYNELVLKAYSLLSQVNKSSFVSALQYCGIKKDIEVNKISSEEELEEAIKSKHFIVTVSKGNLMLQQGDWSQTTGSKNNNIATDKKIFKDKESEKHIKLVFNIEVSYSILRELNLNSKKQVPMISTLCGFEPYNLIDMSNDEYIKQKAESDVKAIIFSEKYEEHIKFLTNISPYQAANTFLVLQTELNMSIQKCIKEILSQGHVLTVDSLIHYNYESFAEAVRELLTKYHAFETTEEEKIKIKRFIALYFAVIEEDQIKVENYIISMKNKYGIVENE